MKEEKNKEDHAFWTRFETVEQFRLQVNLEIYSLPKYEKIVNDEFAHNNGLNKKQFDYCFNSEKPTYLAFVSFESGKEEVIGSKCTACGSIVNSSEKVKKRHHEMCDFSYCFDCYRFVHDFEIHKCEDNIRS